ncbi:MAG: site-specific DNA-methyltransferase [Ktedonobacteraceae bacterium]|nr:site-specific DNA-methyltransferase [Ktedonobacteraceae bacterium]
MAELVWPHKRPLSEIQTERSPTPQIIASHHYPARQCSPEHKHTPWMNRLIQAERSTALYALLPEFRGSIDLIYIDPPFMTGRTFTTGNQVAYHDHWNNNIDLYLDWLYETLALLHALLTPNGSLYVHLDWRATHYAKLLLDEIFGGSPHKNGPGFKNEIIWHYQSGGHAHRYYARKHDTILLYTKSARYCFHGERVAVSRGAQRRNHMRKKVDGAGKVSWTIRSGSRVYTYHEDSPMLLSDVWSDISHLHQKDPERTGYATQKPIALLERLILASSEEHDLVLDCFCGSGVTPIAAEQLKRRWIACDSSKLAITTTCERLQTLPHLQPFALQHIISIPP